MNRNVMLVIFVVALVGSAYFLGRQSSTLEMQSWTAFDPLNTTYTIDEQPIIMADGKFETSTAPESAMKDVVTVFGVPTSGDLNRDGRLDAAVYLMENPGGTGTFFYIAAAINTKSGAKGTNAIFLGDRIAPQTLEIRDNTIIANYADRKPDEPMAAQPSVGVSKYFVVSQGILREAANPNISTTTAN